MKFSHVIVSVCLGEIKKLIIEDISIVSLRPIWRQSVRKKVNKYLWRISPLYRKRKSSGKEVFLKILLQYSQKNTYIRVSWQTFKSAILSKRDSKADVFLWILRHLKNTYFEEHLRTTASYFMKKYRTQLKTKQPI